MYIAPGATTGFGLSFGANFVADVNAKMRYGLYWNNGDMASATFRDNYMVGASDYGLRFVTAGAVREWRDNNLNGTLGTVLNFPTSARGSVRNSERFDCSAPTTGRSEVGDVVWNRTPAPSGTMGWVCTIAGPPGPPGTPGTWKTFGAISA